jgi:hypothetical protein
MTVRSRQKGISMAYKGRRAKERKFSLASWRRVTVNHEVNELRRKLNEAEQRAKKGKANDEEAD